MYVCMYVCICLSIFLPVFKVSSKEIKVILFDSSFMLTCAIGHSNMQTLKAYNVI